MEIRTATPADFAEIWPLFQAVIRSGDTYVFTPETPEQDAYDYWFGRGVRCWVAVHEQRIVGMYKLIDNQRGLGAHVANASFMVDQKVRGLGIGKALGLHCIDQATTLGYRAIQFNFVVSTNTLPSRCGKNWASKLLLHCLKRLTIANSVMSMPM